MNADNHTGSVGHPTKTLPPVLSPTADAIVSGASDCNADSFGFLAFDSITDQVAVLNAQGVILAVNQAWREFAESSEPAGQVKPSVGINYFTACALAGNDTYGREATALMAGMQAVLQGHRSEFLLEYANEGPGESHWFCASVVPLRGSVQGLVVSHRNITDRKRMELALQAREQQLRESEQRFAIALDATSDGLWDWNIPSGNVCFSSQLVRMLEFRPEEIHGRVEFLHQLIHPEDRERVLQTLNDQLTGAAPAEVVEVRLQRKSGQYGWFSHMGRVVARDPHGAPLRMVGTIADITARKLAEAKCRALEEQLRESQKMEAMGTLAGGIAHDFNNIVAIILGNLELARMHLPENAEHLSENFDEIRKAAKRAGCLVQQILSFSRRQPTRRKLTDLPEVIEESVRLLRATLPTRISVHASCASDVPAVMADDVQIEQAILNLATNAMQAIAREGLIEILLDTVTLSESLLAMQPTLNGLKVRLGSVVVRLRVSDNGPGIDPAAMSRIFEPFFTTKPAGQGTGLGLAIVQNIIHEFEGVITVTSTPGNGATFAIYLPPAEVAG